MSSLKKSFERPPCERMVGGPQTRQALRPKHKKQQWYDDLDPHETETRLEEAQGDVQEVLDDAS